MPVFKLILMGLLTLTVLGCSGDVPDVTQEMQGYMQDIEATVEARLAEERAIENRIEVEVEAKIAEMLAFAERYGSGERIATATPDVVATSTVVAPTVVAPTVVAPTVVAPTVVAPTVVAEVTVVQGAAAPVESVIADDSTGCSGYGEYTVSGTVAGYPDGTRVLGVVGDIYVGSAILAAAYYELIIDLCAEDGTSLENQYMKFNVGGKTAEQEVVLTSGGIVSRQLTVP